MNCLSNKTGSLKLASSRGFYVQKREDHITPVLFHIWAAFPDCSWGASLLDLWRISHGHIQRIRWSYSWEQKRELYRRPDITDIVIRWEDDQGQAVLVIEAKRPHGKLSDKDINGGAAYLQMPSIRPFKRKSVAFLVDEADLDATSRSFRRASPLLHGRLSGDSKLVTLLGLASQRKKRISFVLLLRNTTTTSDWHLEQLTICRAGNILMVPERGTTLCVH